MVFMGPAWRDAHLIELAFGFEQATHARRAPRFLPTVDFTAPAGAAR
jgi:amidase